MKKIKVAISQRIIPHYRLPVFAELASRENIDLTVFFGKGFKTGSQANTIKAEGFKSKKLFTFFLNYNGKYGTRQLRVWHPFLIFRLIFSNFDVVIAEPTTNFYNDIFIFLYCKLFRKKFIWYDSGSVPKNERPLFRRMIDPIVSTFIKGADAYITYTSYADKSLLRDFPINPQKIFRAQNTVDISKIDTELVSFQPFIDKKKADLNLNGFKISIYIGGIEQRKKINNLITATTNLNNEGISAKTLIVGDGPDIEWVISNMTEKEKLLTVFAGKQINEATLYIMLADVVVLPSAGGLSVIQAFACKKPFVGSKDIEYGGIKDYVSDGENGFLVIDNDIPDLQLALKKLFTNDKLYNQCCENAYKKSKELTISNMVNGIENAIIFSMNQ